jgi:hypothetical protein
MIIAKELLHKIGTPEKLVHESFLSVTGCRKPSLSDIEGSRLIAFNRR